MVDKPFELGKTYHHTTGRKVTIVGLVQTHVYGLARDDWREEQEKRKPPVERELCHD